MHVANQVSWYQKRAENIILNLAQELKEGLCISHDKAVSLAREMHPTSTIIAKWKE
jgi:hypothetical protein